MPLRAEDQKQERIAGILGRVGERFPSPRASAIQRFVRQFYSHVPPEDVVPRGADDLYGAALSLWNFAQERKAGQAKLRAFNPRADTDGWHAGRTVIEIVNDDMPFLVDSVAAALNGLGLTVHLVIHPIIRVRRNEKGKLVELLDSDGGNGEVSVRESLMHVEASEQDDPARLAEIASALERVLADVRVAVADWARMRGMLAEVREAMVAGPHPAVPPEEVREAEEFLRWLGDDNFTFLGYRRYRFAKQGNGLDIGIGDGLGILRDESYAVFDGLRHFDTLPTEVQEFLREARLLSIAKTNKRATVHRPAQMDAISVRIFAPDGEVLGEHLFVGLFTSTAYASSARATPLLRRKVEHVLQRAGFPPQSHDAKAIVHILDGLPRDELFQSSEPELFDTALGVLNLQERQRIALFVRRDNFGRFVSCLVYCPRERYNTELRKRFAAILEAAFRGTVSHFDTQFGESVLARVHFIVSTPDRGAREVDVAEAERRLAEAGRSWEDVLSEALADGLGEAEGNALFRRYAGAFPTSYRERYSAATALYDIERIEEVRAGTPLALTLYKPVEAGPQELGFKIYRKEEPVPLSDVLPVLERLGLRVVSEEPFRIQPAGDAEGVAMQDFALTVEADCDVSRDRQRFEQAFQRIWAGDMESDGFNRLVLGARLDWREVVVLRLYAKVLRQASFPFSQAYLEDTLAAYPALAAKLAALFRARFDPAQSDPAGETERRAKEIETDLESVTNLDEDRILRAYLTLIRGSLRTNFFQRQATGAPKPYLSVKLESHAIELFPLPRPLYEIYVLSPRMEGVHLRGGKIARGGIRWSDRKEDFRTEILGLMKAQMVKNAVIVPVGSKGGFVLKRPPPVGAGRDALQAEGVECYKILMRGLLDITDNIAGDKIVPPAEVVRLDDDDPYLVVAADKGTATFSDIANGVSEEYGFWLGDAYASGGSQGYDHKAIGITARGAWETVKRHFRELGTDIQATDFTCVGVGDMSGDVFGNGMLRSKHTRLIGAFDHRHVFLDPDPDPERTFAERQRLFDLPRSSWADFDAKLISKGGGVYPRSLKSLPVSAEMRKWLKLRSDRPTPAEVINALLKAKVDLLWFGGIGTYVKASTESHAEVGDRANDAVRINATKIRAKVVGEGANLGVTQRARIEYAQCGGRINTDAIDNSAGVDTSDHEVNLKILLNAAVSSGDLTMKQRNAALREVTDDVAQHVLRNNYLQGLALTLAQMQAADRLDAHARFMRALEKAGKLDRAVEFLPDDETLGERAAARRGLTRPELAVLMAYAKNTLAQDLTATDLPDDLHLLADLEAYFPPKLVERFRPQIGSHRLRREIVATLVANDLVNRCGITFAAEIQERTGRGLGDVARSYAIVRAVYDLDALWDGVNALDNAVAAETQAELLLAARRVVERATAWFLRGMNALDIAERIGAFRPGVQKLWADLPELMPDSQRNELARRVQVWTQRKVPPELAERVARLDFLGSAVDIVRLCAATGGEIDALGQRAFAVGARFRLDLLRMAARKLPAQTAWQKLAVNALIEDLYGHQADLAAKALGEAAEFEKWLQMHAGDLAHLDGLIQEILHAPAPDLAMLTVANRAFRALVAV